MKLPSRILVTGASGFVGRHLTAELRKRLPAVTVIGTSRNGEVLPHVDETLLLDLADPYGLAAIIRKAKPDVVVHLAACADVALSFRKPLETWSTNLLGTVALAEAVRIERPEAFLLFVSSAEVYGRSFLGNDTLGETAALLPNNPYAASKAAADMAMEEMSIRGLRVVRVRPFAHTGPGQSPNYVVPAFARKIAGIEAGLREPVLHTGALDRWRDLTDVSDVCEAYVDIILSQDRLPNGIALNVCSGQTQRIGDVLESLLAKAGVRATVEESAALLRPTDVVRLCGDASVLHGYTGWEPKIPWDATLDAVLADWREKVRLFPAEAVTD